jgi:uncharacterized protein (DUF2236 family)
MPGRPVEETVTEAATARHPVLDAERGLLARMAPEGILVSGGLRAILLQIAHPGVGAGVAAHSNFSERPLDRLRTTLTYVYAVSLGTPDEAARVSRIVNAVHKRVRGHGYSADDPQLQLWVAATLYDTGAMIYERIFGPLPEDEAEEAYQQHALLATSLRVPRELWPADRAAFADYWHKTIETIEVSDDALSVAADLLHPHNVPLALRAGMPLMRFLTTAWLPPRIRAAYGLQWSDRRQQAYERLMDLGALTYPRTPRLIRHAPAKFYLRDMRKRLATHKDVISSRS